MSKQVEGIRRMLLVLGRLRHGGGFVPKAELLDYVNWYMTEVYGYGKIGERTLERDIGAIGELFGVYISFSRAGQGYFIDEQGGDYGERVSELMMSFDLIHGLNGGQDLASFVLPEHHRPLHSEWLGPLVRAIRGMHPVEFDYVNYRAGGSVKHFAVRPHYLKESNRRWYLLAYDGGVMKTFGVDRIRGLVTLEGEVFRRDTDVDVAELFRDCYGLWNDARVPVEDIELRFDALDGCFVKSDPIHSSQRVLADTPEELRIALRLRITNDFVMELLSRSRSLEVIRPLHLRERVRGIYAEALRRNS